MKSHLAYPMGMAKPNVCPECDYEFKGKGWEGIDAHWRANHNQIKRYEECAAADFTGQIQAQGQTLLTRGL